MKNKEECGYIAYIGDVRFITPKGKCVWQNITAIKNALRCHSNSCNAIAKGNRISIARLIPETYQQFIFTNKGKGLWKFEEVNINEGE